MSTDTPAPDQQHDIWRHDNAFRQITAVFVDVVDSSALMQQLGLDDYSAFLDDVQTMIADEARSAGGYVAEYLGDGVVLYFGYPRVTGEDQISALACALAIIRGGHALRQCFAGLRIGIATGQSILDRDEGTAGTRRAVGDCLTKAARIQALTEPNGIAVCATTTTLCRDLFDFEPMGAHDLKGFAKAESLFRLAGARAGAGTDAAPRQTTYGRIAEHQAIAADLAAARAGNGRAVLLSGETGIGKSHFLRDMLGRLLPPDAGALVLNCTPITARTSFLPVADMLDRIAFRLSGEGGADDGADCGTDGGAPMADLVSNTLGMPPPLAAALMAILRPATVEVESGHGARMIMSGARAAALDLLADRLLGLAATRFGHLLAIEDLHWADAATAGFVRLLMEKSGGHGCLVAATTRPEGAFRDPPPGVRLIALHPLDPTDSLGIVRALRPDISDDLARTACQIAGGVPLLLEEYAQVLTDTPLAAAAMDRGAMTATVHALVQTKLDRLGIHAQRLVEVGAVIGQQFPVAMACTVAGIAADRADDVLAHLQRLDLIRQLPRTDRESRIDFKHALIGDAIYAAIPGRRRALIHNAVAERYEAERDTTSPAVIASHYRRGDKPLKAARFYLIAAQRASHLGDPVETLTQVGRALDCVSALEGTREATEIEIAARALEGLARMVMQGPGSPDFGASVLRARALLRDTGGAPSGQVLFGAGLHSWASARYEQAGTMIADLREGFARSDPGPAFAADLLDGLVAWHRGQTRSALHSFTAVRDRFTPERDDPLYSVYLMDFDTFAGFYSTLCHAALGDPKAARRMARRTLETAEPRLRPHPIGFSLLASFAAAMFADDAPRAAHHAHRCIQHSTAFGFPEFVALAQGCLGWVALREGRTTEGADLIETGRTGWEATGFRSWHGLFAALDTVALVSTRTDGVTQRIKAARKLIAERQELQFLPLIDAIDARLSASGAMTAAQDRIHPAFLLRCLATA